MQTQLQIATKVKIYTFLHESSSALIFFSCTIKGQNENTSSFNIIP